MGEKNFYKGTFLIGIVLFLVGVVNASAFGYDSNGLTCTSSPVTVNILSNNNLTDTNASTECSGAQVLLGNASCHAISPFLAAAGSDTNCSDGSCSGLIYWANESILNVNSSDYWDELGTINVTQFENNGGVLNFLETWISSMVDKYFKNYFNQQLNITSSPSFTSINITGDKITNGTDWFSFEDLNNTGSFVDTDTNCSTGNCPQVFYFANQSLLNETDKLNVINSTIQSSNASWLSTYNATYEGNLDTNCSDGSCSGLIYWANESILNVNSSDYWDELGTINVTQFENNGGVLNFLETWISSMVDKYFKNYFNQQLNITSSPSFTSINITGDKITNGTDWFSFEDLNNTGSFVDTDTNCSTGNCPQVFYFANQSLLNETDKLNVINSTIQSSNASWLSTYNATYEAHIDFVTTNLAWQNQTNVFSVNQNNSGNITLTDTVDFSITNNGSCGILIGATTTLEIC